MEPPLLRFSRKSTSNKCNNSTNIVRSDEDNCTSILADTMCFKWIHTYPSECGYYKLRMRKKTLINTSKRRRKLQIFEYHTRGKFISGGGIIPS